MTDTMHVRIDNRLLHGQVVQYWIPFLDVNRLVIADDEAADNPAMSAVYRMAVPGRVDLSVVPVRDLAREISTSEATTTLILISDVFDATRAQVGGLSFDRLVLGNVHAAPGRTRITDSVYLSREEIDSLMRFRLNGGIVEIQTFPGERLQLEIDDNGEPKWSKR
jgi:mannose/fructose/N-acetylgalactosamine-specific phosphotransferase system component IIB